MTPAARVAAVIGVLDQWLAGAPAEKVLTTWARGARYAGSKDRAAVRDHVYDVLRRRGRCAALGGADGRGLMLGLMRLQGIDPSEIFTGVGHAPAALTDPERAPRAASFPTPWEDVPDWLHPALHDSLGASAEEVLAALQDRAPLYVRVNARKGAVNMVQERLSKDGIETIKTDCNNALKVIDGSRRLHLSEAYADGSVEIQDLSVQMACAALDWPPSGRVLDLCAGGGGKALAIAAVSDAQVFVHDAKTARMADIPARAARAGVTLRQTAPEASASYDLVLCDVPCSGSGTWRRDPEAKWRLTPEKLAGLGQVQRQIIQQAQSLVAPGGRVVYMTCSLLRVENEDLVEAAVAAPGWNLMQCRRYLPPAASDGFFLAELQRDG